MKTNRFTLLLFLASLFLLISNSSQAQLSSEEMAKIAQNPIANLISLPIQTSYNSSFGPFDRDQVITKIQPIIPFKDGKIITRTIIPIVKQPYMLKREGYKKGISDINFSAFYTFDVGSMKVGAGPIISFPTADEGLGAHEWAVGPSAVFVAKPKNWVIGTLINNTWSVNNNEVKSLLIQSFVNYNLKKGYYLTTAPQITANWTKRDGEKWTVPLGMGVGKVITIPGFLPLNVQAGAYRNVVKPTFHNEWSFKVGATFMVPTALFKKN